MLATSRFVAHRFLQTSCSHANAAEGEKKPVPTPEEAGWAFNHVEKKMGMYKPKHTIEEQIAYMKSKAYNDAYKGLTIYTWYKRNVKGQLIRQPPPRLFCIDRHGRFNINHACPVCRDEYLFFDYRNPSLIEQFLSQGSDKPIDIFKSGLCREQYAQLQAQLLKAKEHGTITFSIEFRNFDYRQWYKEYKEEPSKQIPLSHFQLLKGIITTIGINGGYGMINLLVRQSSLCLLNMTSAIKFAGTALRELRIHLCQKSSASAGVRAFVQNDYVPLKKANPDFPILIREASGISPRVFARYEHGVERQLPLENVSQEGVAAAIRDLASKQ